MEYLNIGQVLFQYTFAEDDEQERRFTVNEGSRFKHEFRGYMTT
jgi:hypothetical protein